MIRINIEKTIIKEEEYLKNKSLMGDNSVEEVDEERKRVLAKYGDFDPVPFEDGMIILHGSKNIVWEKN